MIKIILFILILPFYTNGQSLVLTFSDFKGTPKAEHTALSSISIGFEYTDLGDGHVIFEDAAVQFHQEASYCNSNDPYILNHEQGHYNIALALCNYVNNLPHIHHIHYTKAQFEEMKNTMIRRWIRDDNRYDKETNNSINHEAQASWDLWIAKQLLK